MMKTTQILSSKANPKINPQITQEYNGKTIVHFDLDAFFASCEQLKHSALQGQPILVGGKSARGVVASCSYEARKFGVRSAMPMRYALQLCPHARVVKGDMGMYSKYSKTVTEILGEQAPILEKASIDEFYLDISGLDKYFGCYKWTKELAQKVTKETGLPISFGLSVNKTVSKIATTEGKPKGKLNIPPPSVRPFLNPLSISKLPMVGPKTFKTLSRLGIRTIKTFSEVPPEMAKKLLGKNGTVLLKRANGIDPRPVIPYSERKSISTERTFHEDTIDVQFLKAILVGMVEKLAHKLREEDRSCSVIAVKIRYSNFDTHSQQSKVAYTNLDHLLITQAKTLLNKLYTRRMRLRMIGVRLGGLVDGGHQMNLFDDHSNMAQLYQSMDLIKRKFGNKAIRRSEGMV